MRIVAGQFRGRALASVGKGDAGAHLRPTTDRVRESLFNVLTHTGVLPEARVLDLFAGTGALGLEALSRGGAHVTFVDDGRAAQGLIRKNIELTRSAAQTSLLRRDATRMPQNPDAAYTLIFLDPPYGKNLGQKALKAALEGGWLADDALIVWEENQPMAAPDGFSLHDQRKYGDTHISLIWRDHISKAGAQHA
ncbi:16S rRNA (guanine(966)-N(2))-methyltransferase RsmD [Ruegeria sp. 2205SS24-7]|uniref:16S rRNA (guanine(966)-N(2))-methyltransferase RsmD n=1 Tax=Ruegeria discodermiae TaxID=3064389 RepID=UPI002741C4E5|nr:16S rRNA (guanine(966)-N(2))-methyltransferase RsmD [Ruegeria sp. 2205SS24-7]MDP5218334.1 16S rRNA (guanine(966)-N(2))-methyltransferase RsmD [Ruegeria sp. 2205SS24-7]